MVINKQKTTVPKGDGVPQEWFHVDATDRVLGRLAVKIASVLVGKHKPSYVPHIDSGDFVVVTNVGRLRISGGKLDQRSYARYSGYPGGYKTDSMRQVFEKTPERVLTEAVRRMMPKNALSRRALKKLKIYRGESHPHTAQRPAEWNF